MTPEQDMAEIAFGATPAAASGVLTNEQIDELDHDLLSTLAGIDTYDVNLRDQPAAYTALKAYRAALAAPAAPVAPVPDFDLLNRLVDLGAKAAHANAQANSDDGHKGSVAQASFYDLRREMWSLIAGRATPPAPAGMAVTEAAAPSVQRVDIPESLRNKAEGIHNDLILYNGESVEPCIDIDGSDLWCDASDFTPAHRQVIRFMVEAANFTLALIRATPPAPAGMAVAEPTWRCFHCEEVFTDEASAAEHFGTRLSHDPACTINVAEYRAMEKRMESNNAEDAEIHRAMYAMQSDHAQALIREEQKGYERGLDDAKKHPEELGLCAVPPAAAQDEARFTLDEIEQACMLAEVSEGHSESVRINLLAARKEPRS